MKTSLHIIAPILMNAACGIGLLHAQGSLTPPAGPPAPVMKTLDQIEARTPVNEDTCPGNGNAIYVIGNPGSYYLTGNISGQAGKAALQVNAAGVILDLNGFSLTAAVGSTKGIIVSSAGGPVAIRNGVVRLWPQGGIQFTAASDFTIEDVIIYGAAGRGIDALGRGTIERVTIQGAKDYGIYCLGSGQVVIRDCRVENVTSSGNAAGIYATNANITGCSVATVTAPGSTLAGINAPDSIVSSCTVRGITMNGTGRVSGIESATVVSDCHISSITGNGGGATTVDAAGIFSCSTVSNCRVSVVAGGGSHPAWGISTCAGVDSCSVYTVSGSGTRGAIKATRVANSTVGGVAGGSGITGRSVVECHISNCGTGITLEQDGLGGAGLATGNTIEDCTSTGIMLFGKSSHVTGNLVTGDGSTPGSTGILAASPTAIVRIDGNTVTRWTTGINAPNSNMVVVRNMAGLNTTDYTINAAMPVVVSPALGTNPNANVSQ